MRGSKRAVILWGLRPGSGSERTIWVEIFYSRLVYGARTSIEVAILANIVATVIGVSIGAVAGFFGGLVDTLLMHFTDVMMSFPIILFAGFLAVALRPGITALILIIGFVSWFYLARIVRGEVLSVKNRDSVQG